MAIQNYAIIDHVGSLDSDTNKKAYNKIYLKAQHEGFVKDKTLYTMKKACELDSPYAKKVTDKMKQRIRHQKHPKKVYFICPELNYYTERELKKWYDRCIDITVYEAEHNFMYEYKTVYDTNKYSFHNTKESKLDRICNMYGPCLGFSFEAPTAHVDKILIPDNYCKRPDHDMIIASGETHFTKPFTKLERFYEYNCCILSEEQKKECLQKLSYLLKETGCTIDLNLGATFGALSGNIEYFNTFLECDYIICEACHRPRNIRNHKDKNGHNSLYSICTHCEAEFDDGTLVDTTQYFDDSYTDEYEDNPYMDFENTLLSSAFFPEEFTDEWINQF